MQVLTDDLPRLAHADAVYGGPHVDA